MKNEHHEHSHTHHHHDSPSGSVLTIRAHSGLSGDIFLAGLLCMTGIEQNELDKKLAAIMPELEGSVHLVRTEVNHRVNRVSGGTQIVTTVQTGDTTPLMIWSAVALGCGVILLVVGMAAWKRNREKGE